MDILNLIISAISGGVLTSIITLGAQRRIVLSKAKSTELDNTKKAIEIWRSLAKELEHRLDQSEENIEKIKQTSCKVKYCNKRESLI
jgi:hypothetical protein